MGKINLSHDGQSHNELMSIFKTLEPRSTTLLITVGAGVQLKTEERMCRSSVLNCRHSPSADCDLSRSAAFFRDFAQDTRPFKRFSHPFLKLHGDHAVSRDMPREAVNTAFTLSPNMYFAQAALATRPKTTQSRREVLPNRLLPCTPPATSPAAYRPRIASQSEPKTAEFSSISKPPMQ